MSFLLSHCSLNEDKDRGALSAGKRALVPRLLDELVLFVGHYALGNASNQDTLRWGQPPTTLHMLCDLPFSYFSDET